MGWTRSAHDGEALGMDKGLKKELLIIAKNVRTLRQAQRLTRQQLAERAGLSVSSVRAIESATTNMWVTTIFKMATAFGVKPMELVTKR